MVDNATERGMALSEDATEVPDLWRRVSRLADAIKVCLDRHSELRRTDPEYREALDYLKKLLSARPGQVGQMIRMVSAGQHASGQGAVTGQVNRRYSGA